MKLFFLVLARDEEHVTEKAEELNCMGVPYLIVCGDKLSHPKVIHRQPRGKYDAINFGAKLIPEDVEVVALNDVDTRVNNVDAAVRHFNSKNVALVFAKVWVKEGPQKSFYVVLDSIRRRVPINASGELMLIRRTMLESILPLKPCKAEDSYILFKVLESRRKVVFCEESYVETERTKRAEQEEAYKRKVVCGLYQALGFTKPSFSIRLFYVLLPLASPILLVLGKKGYFWMKGILLGLTDYLHGDRSGVWQSAYLK
jgi:cellulose synthase/poly-beta-1,6-N-acetylglucosamine synthase-like glycosyltransferase